MTTYHIMKLSRSVRNFHYIFGIMYHFCTESANICRSLFDYMMPRFSFPSTSICFFKSLICCISCGHRSSYFELYANCNCCNRSSGLACHNIRSSRPASQAHNAANCCSCNNILPLYFSMNSIRIYRTANSSNHCSNRCSEEHKRFTIWVNVNYRIIITINIPVISIHYGVFGEESPVYRVIVPRHEVIQSCFGIIPIACVPERVFYCFG